MHFKTDKLTSAQHDALDTRVRDLMSTPPSTLLTKDWYLLSEDFHLLGEGPVAIRQVWVASMESALGGAIKHAAGRLVPGSHPYILSLHRPHRFTRMPGCPYISQPISTNDAADHPPQNHLNNRIQIYIISPTPFANGLPQQNGCLYTAMHRYTASTARYQQLHLRRKLVG